MIQDSKLKLEEDHQKSLDDQRLKEQSLNNKIETTKQDYINLQEQIQSMNHKLEQQSQNISNDFETKLQIQTKKNQDLEEELKQT